MCSLAQHPTASSSGYLCNDFTSSRYVDSAGSTMQVGYGFHGRPGSESWSLLEVMVRGHEEAEGHTWYSIECKTGRAEWRTRKRLSQLRTSLHDPVKSELSQSQYSKYFSSAPFASRGGLPGTSARLSAWCRCLADVVNSGELPPWLVTQVLSFLDAPLLQATETESTAADGSAREEQSSQGQDLEDASPSSSSRYKFVESALSELFRPPSELLFKGPFPDAMRAALGTQRWLLVNIQDAEMASHMLNRDIWRHSSVSGIVFESFVLWQQLSTAPEGQQFKDRFLFDWESLPVICVVDPRKGCCVHRWPGSSWKDPRIAVKSLSDFLIKNPGLTSPALLPVVGNTAEQISKCQIPGKGIESVHNSCVLTAAQAAGLADHLPLWARFRDWSLAYSSRVHGVSIQTFYRNQQNRPSILVVRDANGGIFGGFAAEPWHVARQSYGTRESFAFLLQAAELKAGEAPRTFSTFRIFGCSNSGSIIQWSDEEMFALGGALVIRSNFLQGSSSQCETFKSPPLCVGGCDFVVQDLECWSIEEHERE